MQYIDDVMDYAAWVANHPQEAAHVKPASYWCEEVVKAFHDESKNVSVSLPFRSTTMRFAFRPKEVTIWSGVNGHAKTAVISASALYWSANGERICLASLEMDPVKQLRRMARQATGREVPSADLIRRFHAWTDGTLWLYNQTKKTKASRMLDLGHYVAGELNCTHFVIDNLSMLDVPSDGIGWLTAQKTFMADICALAKDTGMHVHVVMHPRKGDDEKKEMGKMDVRGAGELTDMTDNLIIIWADIAKREAMSLGKADHEQVEAPDFMLTVKKQRHGEWTGKVPLWSQPESLQFKTGSRSEPPPAPWVT